VVAPGENLFRIGVAYGIDYRELASANHIDDPSLIEVGQRLFIPRHARH
jgi:2',3'-cyclic-nucleotide 2'-phosphodiesterase/3'-nucleotidase